MILFPGLNLKKHLLIVIIDPEIGVSCQVTLVPNPDPKFILECKIIGLELINWR